MVDSLTPQFGISLETAILNALLDVLQRLEIAVATPRVRALRTQAQAYMRALERWAYAPPSEESRDAMLELVTDLQQEILSGSESIQ